MYKMTNKTFTITKRIAKHGNQAIIVIPKILEEQLKPGTIAEININILNENIDKNKKKKNGNWFSR